MEEGRGEGRKGEEGVEKEKQDGEGMKTERGESHFFLFFISMQEHRGLLNIKYPVEVGIISIQSIASLVLIWSVWS